MYSLDRREGQAKELGTGDGISVVPLPKRVLTSRTLLANHASPESLSVFMCKMKMAIRSCPAGLCKS